MNNILHKVTHRYQPTNNTCGYTALSILLSYYSKTCSPEELVSKVPQPKDSEGTSHGSVTAQLADWCQTQGFQTHMYVSDMYILDLSWQDKGSMQIKERLEQVKGKRKTPNMDAHWVGIYEDAYLSMLNHGADITVVPFITTRLINRLLKDAPVYANICSTALRGDGRSIASVINGQRKSTPDDIGGTVGTHSTVIYGIDEDGRYLVSDPWVGQIKVEPEKMVLAIEAAQIECDNQIFVLNKVV